MFRCIKPNTILLAAVLALFSCSAQAQLFSDKKAREAILELRQQVAQLSADNETMRHNLLELNQQIEQLQSSNASLIGLTETMQFRTEQLEQTSDKLDQRLVKFEPTEISLDGLRFIAEAEEINAYNQAIKIFKQADFVAASKSFTQFMQKYPRSGYLPSALFWNGNAAYANRNYNIAIKSFQRLIKLAPQHERIADAMLGIANSQIELKSITNARNTLKEIIKNYPDTSTATDAQRRLNAI